MTRFFASGSRVARRVDVSYTSRNTALCAARAAARTEAAIFAGAGKNGADAELSPLRIFPSSGLPFASRPPGGLSEPCPSTESDAKRVAARRAARNAAVAVSCDARVMHSTMNAQVRIQTGSNASRVSGASKRAPRLCTSLPMAETATERVSSHCFAAVFRLWCTRSLPVVSASSSVVSDPKSSVVVALEASEASASASRLDSSSSKKSSRRSRVRPVFFFVKEETKETSTRSSPAAAARARISKTSGKNTPSVASRHAPGDNVAPRAASTFTSVFNPLCLTSGRNGSAPTAASASNARVRTVSRGEEDSPDVSTRRAMTSHAFHSAFTALRDVRVSSV